MITEQEAQTLMIQFIRLREELKKSNDPALVKQFKKHQQKCVEQFHYLISMKTGRYKAFNNFEDLNQEGLEALCMAMANYNPSKGSFFWWCHKYIDTRIARSANLHTAIRFPLRVAKEFVPHKESILPVLYDEELPQDEAYDKAEDNRNLQDAMTYLNDEQKDIVNMLYGFNEAEPLSINGICKRLGVSRAACKNLIDDALTTLRENIKN